MDEKMCAGVFGQTPRMYGEFSSRFDGVENRLKKVESLIENDVKRDISALYDGFKQTYEEVVVVRKTMNEIY